MYAAAAKDLRASDDWGHIPSLTPNRYRNSFSAMCVKMSNFNFDNAHAQRRARSHGRHQQPLRGGVEITQSSHPRLSETKWDPRWNRYNNGDVRAFILHQLHRIPKPDA